MHGLACMVHQVRCTREIETAVKNLEPVVLGYCLEQLLRFLTHGCCVAESFRSLALPIVLTFSH